MVEEIIYTNGNLTKTGEKLLLKRFNRNEAKRLYMAWTNPQAFRYNDIPEVNLEDKNEWDCVGDIANYAFPSSEGMYYMTIHRINSATGEEELIGNCRFGKCPYKKYRDQNDIWDFGFSIIRADDKLDYSDEEIYKAFMSETEQKATSTKALIPDTTYWGNGYITETIATILEIARRNGIKRVVSGADIHNLGSCKAQVKCGMKLSGFDEDNDPEFMIHLDENEPIVFPNKIEIDEEWEYTLSKIRPILRDKKNQQQMEEERIKKLAKALYRNKQRKIYREKQNTTR